MTAYATLQQIIDAGDPARVAALARFDFDHGACIPPRRDEPGYQAYMDAWQAAEEDELTLAAIFGPADDAAEVGFDVIDYEAEAEDYEEHMADVAFWAHGC